MSAFQFYRVEVTSEDNTRLALRDCGNLEGARRAVEEFRQEWPEARWITTNRHNRSRVTAMVSMTVFKGTTAQERRARAAAGATPHGERRRDAETTISAVVAKQGEKR